MKRLTDRDNTSIMFKRERDIRQARHFITSSATFGDICPPGIEYEYLEEKLRIIGSPRSHYLPRIESGHRFLDEFRGPSLAKHDFNASRSERKWFSALCLTFIS